MEQEGWSLPPEVILTTVATCCQKQLGGLHHSTPNIFQSIIYSANYREQNVWMLDAGREQDWKKTLCDPFDNISARLTGEKHGW